MRRMIKIVVLVVVYVASAVVIDNRLAKAYQASLQETKDYYRVRLEEEARRHRWGC